jgi:uncharacterized protein YkwD
MTVHIKFSLLLAGLMLLTGFSHSFSPLSLDEIMTLVNADRTKQGLPGLTLNSTLNLAALAKAEDMLANHYFAHTSPKGLNPWYWIKALGYNYAYAGENLALGYSSAEDLEASWMNSASHRANILSPNFSDMGLAVIKSQDSTLVVQMFGTQHQYSQK